MPPSSEPRLCTRPSYSPSRCRRDISTRSACGWVSTSVSPATCGLNARTTTAVPSTWGPSSRKGSPCWPRTSASRSGDRATGRDCSAGGRGRGQACRLPPTAYCLLPTAYCLLPTAYCLLLPRYVGGAVEIDAERDPSRRLAAEAHPERVPVVLRGG